MNGFAPDAEVLTWCEVDAAALRANLAALRRRLSPAACLGVVVKSEAYGHGLLPCTREFLGAGADWLVLNSAAEAQTLRRRTRENIAPHGVVSNLLVLIPAPPAVIVSQHHIPRYTDAGIAERLLAKAHYS